MKSWTDIGLIVAIVIGLISAASLPMVSVNAVSPESLRMSKARMEEPSPWALVSEGRLEAWQASPTMHVRDTAEHTAAGTTQLDLVQAKVSSH